MKISGTKVTVKNLQWGTIKLIFDYHDDSYKEIINKRGYTLEDLLGQVGGFLGT